MKKNKIVCSVIMAALLLTAAGCAENRHSDTANDSAIGALNEADYGTKTEGAVAAEDGGICFTEDVTAETEANTYFAKAADSTESSASTETFDITDKTSKTISEAELPEAGLLTAGEWNDNDNWGFFSNLVNSDTISFPSFGLDPRYRTAVTVKSEDGAPTVNATVRLISDDGNVLWSSVTNKKGQAFLFSSEGTAVSVEVESGGSKQTYELKEQGGDSQSVNKTADNEIDVIFNGEGSSYKQTDIMFIVDATGSMSDEMIFLQSEFTAITNEIGTENTRYSVNFYRDEGDEYVTKCNDFTSDAAELQEILNNENADGGGDTPEAVADILKESIYESSWDSESTKLAFLIFDAPPHNGTEETIISAVKEASAKGIRIIPVVSSNSERETELFGRALAINTGGTYVFLTDDSGIGDSHLEPIIGSYEVEKLYDIIIRIINDYRQ